MKLSQQDIERDQIRAVSQMREALCEIEAAQSHLSQAASLLCSIRGVSDEHRKVCARYDPDPRLQAILDGFTGSNGSFLTPTSIDLLARGQIPFEIFRRIQSNLN